jgi:Tfp pilus assembly protein PilF
MNVHLQRATLLFEQHRFADAEQALALALGEEPENMLAHGLMALCLLRREAFGEATEHAEQAVAAAPDNAWPHGVLASVWLLRHDLSKAQAAAEQALALDPSSAERHVLLGRIYFVQSQWQRALEEAFAALAQDPESVDALNLKAECFRKLGKGDLAGSQLQAALAVDPENSETHASLGWLALQQGDRRKAKEHFREALRLDPNSEWAREGVLEAIKAWNPVYRLFLKYIFLMQSLGRRGQWGVIVGGYVGYRIIGDIARNSPQWAPYLYPFIVAYIAFVLLTWLARPLANLSLRLHPLGKLALSHDERIASNWIGGFLAAAILFGLGAWIRDSLLLGPPALVCAGMLFPLAATFSADRPWPRKPLAIYSLISGLCGAAFAVTPWLAILGPNSAAWQAACREIVNISAPLFLLCFVLSFWMGNILMTIRWRR